MSSFIIPNNKATDCGQKYSSIIDVAIQTVYFQNFCKKYCRKTLEATIMKKVPNESILILIHSESIFTIYCLLFSYTNSFNSKKNLKCYFFQQSILKFTSTLTIYLIEMPLNAFAKRADPYQAALVRAA